ncbi:MAG: hypothetical protein MUP71_06445 [Candidatus Aminicenantes bacterium]|nr:hypothetical protein [Candidatus Aminicenantes bacterium]
MPEKIERIKNCNPACTKIVKFMTDKELPANTGISLGVYTKVNGYRHINIFVTFEQKLFNEAPVDLGVTFAFGTNGEMSARRYVNFEENLSDPQRPNFIKVSGQGCWHGSPHNISSYMTRFPVMGPYVQVFVYNRAPSKRKASVWGYLLS